MICVSGLITFSSRLSLSLFLSLPFLFLLPSLSCPPLPRGLRSDDYLCSFPHHNQRRLHPLFRRVQGSISQFSSIVRWFGSVVLCSAASTRGRSFVGRRSRSWPRSLCLWSRLAGVLGPLTRLSSEARQATPLLFILL